MLDLGALTVGDGFGGALACLGACTIGAAAEDGRFGAVAGFSTGSGAVGDGFGALAGFSSGVAAGDNFGLAGYLLMG